MDVSRDELNNIQLIANRVTIFKDISPYENCGSSKWKISQDFNESSTIFEC